MASRIFPFAALMSRGQLNEFCTLFDSHYLARGLAMYRSLERHCDEFRLRAVCMDAESERLLRRVKADRLEVISLAEVEAHDPELRSVRDARSRVEYFWTATPCVCQFVLAREPYLEAITYLDADLLFFESPEAIFAELGAGSVLLIPHRWAPEHARCAVTDGTSDEAYGIFNVQFVTFRRSPNGQEALLWWRERCLECCPALIHPGRFGDQKYLDDWPERFDEVIVLEDPGGGLAPWNVNQYRLEEGDGQVLVDGHPLVFHHYQGLWLHASSPFARLLARAPNRYRQCPIPPAWVWAPRWPLSKTVLGLIWDPYVERVAEAMQELVELGASETLGTERLSGGVVAGRVVKRHLPRHLRRTYWKVRRAARASEPPGPPVTSDAI
jgi:hypothetical protein